MEKTVEYKDSNEVHVYIILLFLQELIIHQQSILLQNNTTCLVPEFTIRSENCGLPLSLSKSLFLKTRGGLRAVWRRVNLHTEDRKFWCEVWGHQEKNETIDLSHILDILLSAITFQKLQVSHLLPFPFFLLFTTVVLWLLFCFFDELPPPWASFTLFWPVQAIMGKKLSNKIKSNTP